jgi:hypothetical protein
MDLLNKVEEIAMTNLLILQNPMSLAICVPPPTIDPKQKRLGVKKRNYKKWIHVFLQEKRKIGRSTTRIPNFFY